MALAGYDLQVAEDAAFTVNVRNFTLGDVLIYHDTGLDPATTYYARTRARDEAGNISAWSDPISARLWYCINPIVGSGHTFDTDTSDFSPIAVEYFAATGTVSLDQTSSGSGTDTANCSLTPSENDCLVITSAGSNSTPGGALSVDSGFTQTAALPFVGGTSYGCGMGYKIQGSAALVSPTWTWTGAAIKTLIVSFKS